MSTVQVYQERYEELELGEIPAYFNLVSEEERPNNNELDRGIWQWVEIRIYEFWYMGNLVAELDFTVWMHHNENSYGGHGYTIIEWMV